MAKPGKMETYLNAWRDQVKIRQNYGFKVLYQFYKFPVHHMARRMFQNCSGIFLKPVSESLGIGRGQFATYLSVQNIVTMIVLIFLEVRL